jgi:hypothetical protein
MIKINLGYKVTKRIDAKRISLHPISQNENTVSIMLCVMKAFLDTIINMSFYSQICYSRLDNKILCLVYILLLFSKLHLKKPDQAQRYIASMDHKALPTVHC